MPNITFTSASFHGPQESIDKLRALLAKVGERNISDILLPIPPFSENGKVHYGDAEKQAVQQAKYEKNSMVYGYTSDYDFVNDVWGSKWGICDIDIYEAESGMLLSCSWQSAWSPAYGLFYAIARLFPDLLCDFDNEDECGNYNAHKVVLKNPQPIIEFMLSKRTDHRDILGNDVFSLLDNNSRSVAYIVPVKEMYEVTDDKGVSVIKERDKVTAEEWENSDPENVSEHGEPEVTETHIVINYLKAEMYINGFNTACDMLVSDSLRAIETRNQYPALP